MGFSLEEAFSFRKDINLKLGIFGSHQGQTRDLWKYHKVKTEVSQKVTIGDVLLRELLVDFSMQLLLASPDEKEVSRLRVAFLEPYYALSAGSSDDLLKIISASEIVEASQRPCKNFQNTILPGDHTAVYEPLLDLENTPITESVRSPQVHLLPTEFVFHDDERRVAQRQLFTFVGSPISLNQPIPAFEVNGTNVVLM